MASSSYYRGRMNAISSQITQKRNRRRTCEQARNNLRSESTYYEITNNMNKASYFLESGIFNASFSLYTDDALRQDVEHSPESDANLSTAIYHLQAEIDALENEIDSLQAQYNSAKNSYNSAKNREWQEYLDSLKPKKD